MTHTSYNMTRETMEGFAAKVLKVTCEGLLAKEQITKETYEDTLNNYTILLIPERSLLSRFKKLFSSDDEDSTLLIRLVKITEPAE